MFRRVGVLKAFPYQKPPHPSYFWNATAWHPEGYRPRPLACATSCCSRPSATAVSPKAPTRPATCRARQASTGTHLEPIERVLHMCASQASHIPSSDLSLLYALAMVARIRLVHDRRFVSRITCRAI